MSLLDLAIVLVALSVAAVLMMPRLAQAPLWRASITPLASIIGSGFLVLGPILILAFGAYAPLAMAALCTWAYAFGVAVRFNIARIDEVVGLRSSLECWLETSASWCLAFAYIVSVAYYLNLLGAFSVSLTPWNDPLSKKLVTTCVFLVILLVGVTRGFKALERLEQVSVGVKLSIIAGLMVALSWFFAQQTAEQELLWSPASVGGWQAIALTAGLLVTVQGFETSRYLGAEYDAPTRITSMRLAQVIATVIYMGYVVALSYVFDPAELEINETAIVGLMGLIAPILPLLLIGAAVSAQFSAAVADTGGSGGLLQELTGGRLSVRSGYVLLVGIGLALTWSAGVFEIIAYASRAFAIYYGLQALIACRGAWLNQSGPGPVAAFGILGLAAFAFAAFGVPIE